jgi:hypothetical protein
MRKPRGYWNYEHCYQEAQKYQTRMGFKNGCSSAYDVAKKNKWIDDYTWFQKPSYNLFWTKEKCYEEARKYRYSTEFRKNCDGAWSKAYKEGWIKEYTWFEDGNKINADKKRIWNKDTCYELAKKCTSRSDFKKHNAQAYKVSRENGWLDDYTWFRNRFGIFYENGIMWTYDKCCEESKKYKSRSEFCKNCVGGYTRALEKGWLDDFTWLKPKLVKEPCNKGSVYWIYGYFDFCEKVCYIGLSRDKARHWRHKQKDKKGNFDSVMSYFNEKHGVLPEPTIIEEALTAETAQEKEAFYIQFFVEKGYTLLNRMKAGSLGSAIIKWDKSACYEEAKKYSYYDDFYKNSTSAYKNAEGNGWIDEYTWLKRKHIKRGYWQNYDNCYNEAKRYDCISEFSKKAPGAYSSANDNGWLNDYVWFDRNAPKIEYTYDICYALAKKCKNISQLVKESSIAYKIARRNGWIKDYIWFKETIRWTDEKVLELASKYSSASDFRKENSGAYDYMLKHSLQQPSSWKARPKWTYDTCYSEALKYKQRSEYRKNSKTSYNVARDKGWLDDYTWLNVTTRPRGYWTYDRCHEEAKKYKTKREFEKGSPGAYDAVITHKWMADFAYLFVDRQKPKGYWTYEKCAEESKKYETLAEWRKKNQTSYNKARDNGWIKDFTWIKNNGQLSLFE